MNPEVRTALLIYILTAVSYLYFFGGGGWNPNAHFDLTRALVEQGTVRINDYHENTGDISRHGDGIYANKAPGTSLLATLPYTILLVTERSLDIDPEDPRVMTFNLYICTFTVSGLLGALIPSILYLYGRRRAGASARSSLTVSLLIAFATPLFLYSSVFFLHVPNAALLLLAFWFSTRAGMKSSILAGLFTGLAVLTNYLGILILPIMAGLVFRSAHRRVRRLLLFALAAAPSGLAFLAYQLAAYGSPFGNPVSANERFRREGAWLGTFQAEPFDALYGLTISPYRGLFYLSPILIFAIAGGILMWRRKVRRTDLFSIMPIVAIFFAFNLFFVHWEGGWCVGPRFLVPTIPFLGIMMLHATAVMRGLWIVLAAVSFANNLAAVAVNYLISIDYRNPLADYIYPVLLSGVWPRLVTWPPHVPAGSGHVSTNLESVAVPPLAGPWGSFNLGELLFGAGDPRSLLPILAWLFTGSALLYRRARRID